MGVIQRMPNHAADFAFENVMRVKGRVSAGLRCLLIVRKPVDPATNLAAVDAVQIKLLVKADRH